VPNVTAIDCEQVDVYGQKLRALGGMSFTVQEARAAFFMLRALPASRWRPGNLKQVSLQNSEARAHTFMADARGLTSVQVYRAKENRNVTKEIPQRINQAWR